MIIPSKVQAKHDLVRPYVNEVAKRVRDIVSALCEREGFAYLGRCKETSSVAEKIETGRYQSWSQLDDLFACAVIVPGLADEPDVLSALQGAFRQVELRLRGSTRKDPEIFRFDATRFIGQLRTEAVSSDESPLRQISFEIQVRTAFEHAWSSATHQVVYKGDRVDWRRARLAAQLKAAVEQLDQLVRGFDVTAAVIAEQQWPDFAARQHLSDSLKAMVTGGQIPSEAAPGSWVRFSENLYKVILAANDVRGADGMALVRTALVVFEKELVAQKKIVPQQATGYPLSLSLLQFCIGSLVRHKTISRPLRKYVPLVTQEMRDIFPEVRVLGTSFDIEGM